MSNYFEQFNGFVLRSEDGNVIAAYDEINQQDNGITFVFVNNQGWGVVDREKNETIPPQFFEIADYENGYAIFTKHNPSNEEGAIDENGYIVVQAKFECIHGFNAHGVSIATYGDFSDNLINTSGKELLPTEYYDNNVHFEVSYKIETLDNGFFDICNNNDLHALAHPCGDVITPFKYTSIVSCTDDLLIANLDKSRVVIDSTGKEITTEQNFIRILPSGYIAAYDNTNILTILDKTGSILLVKKYDIALDYLDSINKLALFLDNTNATITDGKLTIPWEHFGI